MPEKKTFENMLNELETIITELESGSPTLDKMMKLFEDGMKLMKQCQEHLSDVEGKVITLIKTQDKLSEKYGIDKT